MYRESDIEYKFWILLAGLFRHFFFYDTLSKERDFSFGEKN